MRPPRANNFARAMLLLMLAPTLVLGDAESGVKPAPAPMDGMDHGKMEMKDAAATATHWMAPAEAAKRRNPVAASRASIERGRKLFQSHCVTCHGAQGRGDGPAAAALNPQPADLTVMAGQHPDGDFAWKIANGRGAMPAWKSRLKPNQIWDLVNFIQGMAPAHQEQRDSRHDHSQHKH